MTSIFSCYISYFCAASWSKQIRRRD